MRREKAMTNNQSLAIVVALALAGCRGQNQAQRSKPNYEVVQEGSVSGVTSTINGPGETKLPATDTNVDTTTNFTLPTNPNPLGNETAGSTMAGSLPPAPTTSTAPRPTHPRTDARGMASANAPVVTDTIGTTTPPMPKERRVAPPPETDTSATTSTTDTVETTTTSDPKKKKDDANQQQVPPPPPPTDTTGTRG
jgi:hypothetical protein